MNAFDYLVLLGTLAGIAAYGIWRTRGRRDLHTYLKGSRNTGWLTIGLSVMATQASAITFLSTPGQGYQDGLGFVQNYLGMPLALVIIAVVFLPIYRRLGVYTAYEYLGRRFDEKTRLLGAGLFLLQRGLGAGITIYAPAIILSAVMGWRLDVTIIGTGLLAIVYTVSGGNDAVNITQRYQLGIIFVGMFAAGWVLVSRLPAGLTLDDTLTLAGGFGKLRAVDFSPNLNRRYTLLSGLVGGLFLQLSYFGTDQSQVGRYLGGASLRESRLGLMFNALCKIPMQFFILLLGVLAFVFYRFETPPVFFNEPAWNDQAEHGAGGPLNALRAEFDAAHAQERQQIDAWITARHAGDAPAADAARAAALSAHERGETARKSTRDVLHAADAKLPTEDADYIFITFVLHHLPHGLIGLLVAAILAAALSSKAGELNALGSTTTVDFYRPLFRPDTTHARDGRVSNWRKALELPPLSPHEAVAHHVRASKWFTAGWGLVAIGFALSAQMAENLIQAVNILGSIFYGVVLGIFLTAFFLRRVGGTAVFWGALAAQALVIAMYASKAPISYLWYNLIGCAACVAFGVILQVPLAPSRVVSR